VTDEKHKTDELTEEELDETNGEKLPDREVMSLLTFSEPLHGGFSIDPPPPDD
jgi:hypothetical protein